jgi:hypothetical protein
MKMSKETRQAMDRVFKKLMALPHDEFMRKLEESKDGFYAKMLEETGAAEILAKDLQNRIKKRKEKLTSRLRGTCLENKGSERI